MAEAQGLQHGGDGQYRADAGSVVGNSGTVEAAALLPDVQGLPAGKTVSRWRSG